MSHVLESATSKLARLKTLSTSMKLILAAPAILGTALFSAEVVSQGVDLSVFWGEKQYPAPIIRPAPLPKAPGALAPIAAGGFGQVPTGGGPGGLFSDLIAWPIIPIHMTLLPDGRVLTYGTDQNANQGAFVYDIWDPVAGTHTTLSNTTGTDIFCGTGSWVGPGLNNASSPYTGEFLTLGGDLTVNGVRNYSNKNLTLFNPANNSLSPAGTMQFPRWYASTTPMPNGDLLLLGGQLSPGVGNTIPEIYDPPTNSFRTLSTVSIADAQYNGEWYYPVATVGKDGLMYLLQHNGKILRLSTTGTGTLTDTAVRMASGTPVLPRTTVPVRPFLRGYKVLTFRQNKIVQMVDLYNSLPTVTNVATPTYDRQWGNFTLLADGTILASGGTSNLNAQIANQSLQSEIFHPAANYWSLGASAHIGRFYHSTTLLLPDATVLTGGGGAPGPLNNLNVEIYYPPYLYNADGTPAPRPTIVSAPTSVKPGVGFQLTVGPTDQIAGINLVRAGFQTHAYDEDARWVYADYKQIGTTVYGTVLNDPQLTLPGYYMLFVVDPQGHPSIAKMVSIPQTVQ